MIAGLMTFQGSMAADGVKTSPLGNLQHWLARPRAERPALDGSPFASAPLSKTEAKEALDALWRDRVTFLHDTRVAEIKSHVIEINGRTMRFECLSFGDPKAIPPGGRSLFLSLHGGGNAPKEVNDEQWQNQIKLGKAYAPKEGIYVAPRAPTDTWNMWHEAPIDDFFARLIEDLVVFEQVNPNRIYLFGYSAGGDGVYQIAPRTPDRWAAAAMMAGHPNNASPLGLRNLPFAIHVGADDSGYHRNEVALEWDKKLNALQQTDPQGYVHFTELHKGKGHWMDLEDRKAIPWMEQFTRQPLPSKVVWHQGEALHTRCYWLSRPQNELKAGQTLIAERAGQVITLSSTNVETVTVLLNDEMLNLDEPVIIRSRGKTLFSDRVSRTALSLARTLEESGDQNLSFSAAVTVKLTSSPETG